MRICIFLSGLKGLSASAFKVYTKSDSLTIVKTNRGTKLVFDTFRTLQIKEGLLG